MIKKKGNVQFLERGRTQASLTVLTCTRYTRIEYFSWRSVKTLPGPVKVLLSAKTLYRPVNVLLKGLQLKWKFPVVK